MLKKNKLSLTNTSKIAKTHLEHVPQEVINFGIYEYFTKNEFSADFINFLLGLPKAQFETLSKKNPLQPKASSELELWMLDKVSKLREYILDVTTDHDEKLKIQRINNFLNGCLTYTGKDNEYYELECIRAIFGKDTYNKMVEVSRNEENYREFYGNGYQGRRYVNRAFLDEESKLISEIEYSKKPSDYKFIGYKIEINPLVKKFMKVVESFIYREFVKNMDPEKINLKFETIESFFKACNKYSSFKNMRKFKLFKYLTYKGYKYPQEYFERLCESIIMKMKQNEDDIFNPNDSVQKAYDAMALFNADNSIQESNRIATEKKFLKSKTLIADLVYNENHKLLAVVLEHCNFRNDNNGVKKILTKILYYERTLDHLHSIQENYNTFSVCKHLILNDADVTNPTVKIRKDYSISLKRPILHLFIKDLEHEIRNIRDNFSNHKNIIFLFKLVQLTLDKMTYLKFTYKNHENILSHLIEKYNTFYTYLGKKLNQKSDDKILAYSSYYLEAIKKIIKRCPELLNLDYKLYRHPLENTIQSYNLKLLEILLDKSLDIALLNTNNLKMLISSKSISETPLTLCTKQHLVAEGNNLKLITTIFERLVERNKDLLNIANGDGDTPFMLICKNKKLHNLLDFYKEHLESTNLNDSLNIKGLDNFLIQDLMKNGSKLFSLLLTYNSKLISSVKGLEQKLVDNFLTFKDAEKIYLLETFPNLINKIPNLENILETYLMKEKTYEEDVNNIYLLINFFLNKKPGIINQIDNINGCLKNVITSYYFFKDKAKLDIAVKIFKQNPKLLEHVFEDSNETYLMLAAKNKLIKLAIFIVENIKTNKKEYIDLKDTEQKSALYWACTKSFVTTTHEAPLITYLLKHNPEVQQNIFDMLCISTDDFTKSIKESIKKIIQNHCDKKQKEKISTKTNNKTDVNEYLSAFQTTMTKMFEQIQTQSFKRINKNQEGLKQMANTLEKMHHTQILILKELQSLNEQVRAFDQSYKAAGNQQMLHKNK